MTVRTTTTRAKSTKAPKKHLNKAQLKKLKLKVESEMDRIISNSLDQAKKEEITTITKGDDVDSANESIMKHSVLRFATRENLYFKKLEKTLKAIDSDDYGVCEECGAKITFQRLIARPTSTMCITCKEDSERDEMQSFQGRQSKSLGQTVSFTSAR